MFPERIACLHKHVKAASALPEMMVWLLLVAFLSSYGHAWVGFSLKSRFGALESLRLMASTTFPSDTDTASSLSVVDVAARYKVIKYGQAGNPGDFGLENQDSRYATQLETVEVSRVGGLGLDLVEYEALPGNGGIVLVNEVIRGGNSDKAGGFLPGDALVSIKAAGDLSLSSLQSGIPTSLVNVEGLNFDALIGEIGRFRDAEVLSITVKRLITREYVTIAMVGPEGEGAGEMVIPAGYGANLRTELQKQNMNIYDSRMERFDSPYQTGDCGGEGTCGTCLVAVLEGKEFFNQREGVENKGLAKQGMPGNFRWSCRTKLRAGANKGGKVKIMLRPQTRNW